MTERIKQLTEDFLKATTLPIHELVSSFDEDNNIFWFSIRTTQQGVFFGRGGETLESLNHLVRRLVEKEYPEILRTATIVIDVNGEEKRRIDNLKTLAHMMAERARFFKSSITLDPMPAHDRKIIHSFLANSKDVKTESEGTARDRRVVIRYIETDSII
jgi:spoIIIJ-associated protein